MTAITNRKAAGGRPPKFTEARRPITVTLPERILKSLELVNRDRARAIVKCVESAAGDAGQGARYVELVEVLPGQALIVVGSCQSLSKIEWLRLVEIAPARFLLALPPGMPVERLEVEIGDLIDDLEPVAEDERFLLERLRALILQQRRRKTVSKAELLFVDIAKKPEPSS